MDSFDSFEDWMKRHGFASYWGKRLYELTDEKFRETSLVQCYKELTGHSDRDSIVYSRLFQPLEWLAANREDLLENWKCGEVENLPALVNYLKEGWSWEDYLADPTEYEIQELRLARETGITAKELKQDLVYRKLTTAEEIRLAKENKKLMRDLTLRPYYLKLLKMGCKGEELEGLDSELVVWACDNFLGTIDQTLLVYYLKNGLGCRVIIQNREPAELVSVIVQSKELGIVKPYEAFDLVKSLAGYAVTIKCVQGTMLVIDGSSRISSVYEVGLHRTLAEADERFSQVVESVEQLEKSTRVALATLAEQDETWLVLGLFAESEVQKILKYWQLGSPVNAIVAAYTRIKTSEKIERVIVIDGNEVNVFMCVQNQALLRLIKGFATWRVENETLFVFNS